MPPLDSLASKLLNNIVGNSNSLNTLNSLGNKPGGSSSSSSKSRSFVDSSGAGSTSSGTAASPTGRSTSSETAYAAGATSSSGSAAASASTAAPPRTSVTAPAPAPTPTPRPSNNDGATLTPVTGATSRNSSPSNFSLDSTGTGGESTIISEPTDNSNSNSSIALLGNNTNNSNADTTRDPEISAPENNPAVLTVTYDSNGDGYWIGTSDSDVITCGSGIDRIFAGSGDDIVKGNRGNDAIDGGDGNDTLRGGKGQDLLMGGNGDDFLCGNFGTNKLIGGSGADTFAFKPETASAAANPFLADRLVDFNPAEGDRIGLTGGLSVADLTLIAFDTDGDGTADATSIKFSSNNGDRILAVVLGTVNAAGATTLSNADFISLPNEIL